MPPANAFAFAQIPGQAQGGTQSAFNNPVNNYDINFRRGVGVPFALHKADQRVLGNTNFTVISDIEPYLLAGAQFTLFRFTGAGTPPAHAYISSPVWDVIYQNVTSSGLITTPIVMGLTPEGIYHLVEVLAPPGYMIPFGQWRIVVDTNAAGGFAIIPISDTPIPPITYLDGYFYVGNRLDFELPLAGGTGMNMGMAIGGSTMVFVAFAATGYMVLVKMLKGRARYSKTS